MDWLVGAERKTEPVPGRLDLAKAATRFSFVSLASSRSDTGSGDQSPPSAEEASCFIQWDFNYKQSSGPSARYMTCGCAG